MKNKINIAELLKDCPKGMELDCTIWDSGAKVFLEEVLDDNFPYPIAVTVKYNNIKYPKSFTKYGAFNDLPYCKCVIFPKGKTTWEGFQRPFKDGDVCTTIMGGIFLYQKTTVSKYCGSYISINERNELYPHYSSFPEDCCHLATEEEKQKLFDAIKENGYKWNEETKTLVKLPKFKVGDKVMRKATREVHIIERITSTGYLFKDEGGVGFIFKDENLYELLPKKFDLSTLKPFKSKVLVRDEENLAWRPAIFGLYNPQIDKDFPFIVVGGTFYTYCIPYEGNQHLLGTTNDCDNYFKIWKE